MTKEIEKANVLIEALPYIRRFAGTTIVVKYGGSAMTDESMKKSVIQDIAMLKRIGLRPVVVHGGGPSITEMLDRLNKKSSFVDGLRITDAETAGIAEMVLSGTIGKELVQCLQSQGINAVGINGKDGDTLIAHKLLSDGKDLGFVGEIEEVNTMLLETLMGNDFIPVVSPVGTDSEGNTYNINADYAASAIAGALHAEKLVFLTDVEGILRDKNDPGSIIRQLSLGEAHAFIADGTIRGGMIPKTQCCIDGIKKGVQNVHILDGRIPHSLLLEIFTNEGIGTMMTV
ncbi:MAG: acetylglutamate kinase [Sphaerochaetaceae bacterium]|jgi:acetylglutamate kinase|nr:acetylglutamate kinase [Sphaerochaetaceae bacterium]NLO59496.1 acetylglutamate kinase [Spirochaetales bacterium]MDD2405230.1 acetylglutamate kinase [Sphaerochaetaceae bacterium]MDD3671507.1 acetylglutamate kinase [Sphaerochaetaceae bacterium]MDD4259166.1 acetylglutamate kinase [Sphaerochaetaceae bacterium]